MIVFLKKEGCYAMISYEPLWKTMNSLGITTYDLIYKQGINANTIHRIKHGEAVTTKTLDELCFILKCKICDIIEYKEEE